MKLEPLCGTAVHHLGLVVPDVTVAARHVERVYGLAMAVLGASPFPCRHRGSRLDPVVQIALSVSGPPHLELLQAVPRTVWTVSAGFHHIGFVVDDLPSAAAELAELGLPIEVEDISDTGRPTIATYHRDPLGPLVELMSRATAARLNARIAGAS